MNNTYLLRATIVAFSFFCFSLLTAQGLNVERRTCPTHELHEERMNTDADYRKAYLARKARTQERLANAAFQTKSLACETPLIVPIAVHYQNVTDVDVACLRALAADQIRILNEDFQGANDDITNWTDNAAAFFPGIANGEFCVEFVLATRNHPDGFGLVNGDPAVTINETTGEDNLAWSNYFNVYVRNIGALGFSPLGGEGNGDGVVIDNNSFGSGAGCAGFEPTAPYNLGRTLTHELGHYLDLAHIWGDGCAVDDGVEDTPESASSYGACPDISSSSCGSRDLHMNYMDYTSDACMYMFTAGQANVMSAYLNSNLPAVIANADNVTGPAAARIAFMESALTLPEGTINCTTDAFRTIPITVSVSEAPDADARVNLLISGDAEEGVDYTLSSTSFDIAAGDETDKTVFLEILGDGEIETDENITIQLELEASGSNAQLGNLDAIRITISNDDWLPSDVREVALLQQDFNEDLGDWTVVDGGSSAATWQLSLAAGGLNGTQYVMANSDDAGSGVIMDEALLSPVFDGTSVTNLRLDLDQYIRVYNRRTEETFDIEIWNGSSWENIFHHEEADGSLGDYAEPDQQSFDLSAYAAEDNQLRFTYRAEYDWFWILDNITISGLSKPKVQREANQDEGFVELEFGPEETVYFYDQQTGNIMMSLTNLTQHDYGCTRVEVDDANSIDPGARRSSSAAPRMLTDKSFRVTPQNNDDKGKYSISLYYTATEIDGWLAASEETLDDLVMLKAAGSIADANMLEEAPVSRVSFGEDFIFTSSFSTGFSGFALGGAAMALPVEYTDIEAFPLEKTIMVEWTTAAEFNNAGFEVWRKSVAEQSFSKVGFVEAISELQGSGKYEFEDGNVLPGRTYFYQLKQLDFDGSSSDSDVVSAEIQPAGLALITFPNPADDILNVSIAGNDADGRGTAGAMELLDGRGRILRTVELSSLTTTHSLDLTDLTSGIYFLVFTSASERIVKHVIKH
ncbi:M43 family zinc metalloprotease [Neolewinella agarilytica]|uniref:M43 family zinc metalloprotease n=1 Tax=Neolewinella agarilytica TaxID=478744 RepID=UPI002352378F|nr:M43 family zinc metalloprotease [Neolewinella agarilytica]